MKALLAIVIAFVAMLLKKVYATNTTTAWKYLQSCVLLFIVILTVDAVHAGFISDEYALGGDDVALFGINELSVWFGLIVLHLILWATKNRFIQKD